MNEDISLREKTIENKVPTYEEAKQYIYSIDFSNIIAKMVKHQGWLRHEAEALSEIYKNFLFINKKHYGKWGMLPPSEELDEFWHNHILDTEKYRRDCDNIFGHYLDHYPYFGIDEKTNYTDLSNAFSLMCELYLKEFGTEFPKITTRFSKALGFLKRRWTSLQYKQTLYQNQKV